MALTAGTRLGPYEILAPLGAGGMVSSSSSPGGAVLLTWLRRLLDDRHERVRRERELPEAAERGDP